MRRYVLTALAIGGAVTAVVLSLYLLRAFEPLAVWLGEFYQSRGLFQEDSAERLVWAEVLLVVVAAMGAAWCVVDVSRVGQKVFVFLSIALVVAGLSPTLALYGNLLEPFSALAGVLLAGAAGFVYAGTERGARKRVLENVLGMRVSQATFHSLMDAPEAPDFTGSAREATVLTCRVFNHDELRERLDAVDLMRMSNLFLRNASNFLMSRGACLDESGPELVRVFFGLLGEEEDHAERACRAALELRSRLNNLNQECETRWFQRLEWGVGVSTGLVTAGVYGSPQHFHYSGVGAEVDVSRRLAQANLRYGSDLLVSAGVRERVHRVAEFRPMEMYFDPDSEMMSEIYQLLAMSEQFGDEDRARREAFWRGVILYREKKYEEALEAFTRAQPGGRDDAVVAFFLGRCQEGATDPESVRAEGRHELTEHGHARLVEMM